MCRNNKHTFFQKAHAVAMVKAIIQLENKSQGTEIRRSLVAYCVFMSQLSCKTNQFPVVMGVQRNIITNANGGQKWRV